MDRTLKKILEKELQEAKNDGLYKEERIILTPQGVHIKVPEGEVINFCANNYLGLSFHPDIVQAAKEGLSERGFGMSSVRFICGTQDIHKELERKISQFMGIEDTILYSSCFDANGGLFETLLGKEDVIISDALNHASVIDGIRSPVVSETSNGLVLLFDIAKPEQVSAIVRKLADTSTEMVRATPIYFYYVLEGLIKGGDIERS